MVDPSDMTLPRVERMRGEDRMGRRMSGEERMGRRRMSGEERMGRRMGRRMSGEGRMGRRMSKVGYKRRKEGRGREPGLCD